MIEEIRNNNARKLNKMRKFERDVIPIKKCLKNSLEHYLKQCEIAYKLVKEGNSIVTEAEFETGGVADIFVLDSGISYEILKSEKPENIEKKSKYYPDKKIVMVRI